MCLTHAKLLVSYYLAVGRRVMIWHLARQTSLRKFDFVSEESQIFKISSMDEGKYVAAPFFVVFMHIQLNSGSEYHTGKDKMYLLCNST